MSLTLFLAVAAHAEVGDNGYLCQGKPTAGALIGAATPLIEDRAAATVRADEESRRCARDADCQVIAGACHRCWLAVNGVSRTGLIHQIQRQENRENCFRPALPTARALCSDGLCRLRAGLDARHPEPRK